MDIGGRRLIDTRISEQAETILAHRYFLKDTEGEPIEDATQLFWRVAKAIAEVDHQYEVFASDVSSLEQNFFEMMNQLEFLPNSST